PGRNHLHPQAITAVRLAQLTECAESRPDFAVLLNLGLEHPLTLAIVGQDRAQIELRPLPNGIHHPAPFGVRNRLVFVVRRALEPRSDAGGALAILPAVTVFLQMWHGELTCGWISPVGLTRLLNPVGIVVRARFESVSDPCGDQPAERAVGVRFSPHWN